MCVRVQRASVVTDPWDPSTKAVCIPSSLDETRSLIAVRAVLTELGVRQPYYGAVCWCGAPVDPRERIPAQRSPSE